MTKLPANFDWRRSPAHMDLLRKFIKPRDVAQIMSWQYLKQTIKESPGEAIERFIQDGAIIPSGLEASLNRVFTAAQLKEMLKERGLKRSGSKKELVQRLVSDDLSGMEKITGKLRIMQCSEQAVELVAHYEESKQQALDSSKQQSYEALLSGNAKEAYRIYVAYHRQYTDPASSSTPYEVERLQLILSSCPGALKELSVSNLKNLRASVCVAALWRDESAIVWLPDDFSTHLKSSQVAINYLARSAELRGMLARYKDFAKKVRVVFDPNDIDTCELCMALNGKVFDIEDFPELPLEDCTSETGCQCNIEYIYDDDEDSEPFEVVFMEEEDELDEYFEREDPVAKLRQLKEMLESDLITEAEYQKKKEEILSRM